MSHNHSKARQHKLRNTKSFVLESLARAIIIQGSINTTLERAKALRMVIEPLVTIGKKADVAKDNPVQVMNLKRRAFRILKDEDLVEKLFSKISPTYMNINGGYTRITKSHIRTSDRARMAQLSLITYP